MTTQHPNNTILETLSEDQQSESVRKISAASDLTFTNFLDPTNQPQSPFHTGLSTGTELAKLDLASKVNGDSNPQVSQKDRNNSFGGKSSDGNTDNSDSSVKKKFIKLKVSGGQDTEPLKQWDDDLAYHFTQDRENFIGHFKTEDYKVLRGYLDGKGVQLRLYYTMLEPLTKPIASICIVHGLGEHCGRYMDVSYT